ncbi:hypothetical protein fHeYen801_106 [Yersinia phage fHe-Yen8-01]|nr:hypothetical protein fHeYen801_106 [Yersinia phage fHe-Yen8-01]
MIKPIPVKLSISRPSYGDGKEVISIQIRDVASQNTVVDVEISYADFAMCLTGLSHVDAVSTFKGLANVGKVRVRESRSVEYKGSDTKAMSQFLIDNCQEEGWIVEPYLGSQSSKEYLGSGHYRLHYSVVKYVDAPDE